MAHRALRKARKRAAPVARLRWAGFSAGTLALREMDDLWGGSNHRVVPALFTSRRAARLQYEDVRRVRVTTAL